MTRLSPEPVAYYIYVAEHQNGYVVESLNDACDDLTNHNAVSTPLYTAPPNTLLDEVLDALEIARKCIRVVWVSHHANRCDKAEDKLNAAIAALEKYRGQR